MSGQAHQGYGPHGAEVTDWQPIETAPKDGTTIFGANVRLAQRGLVHFNAQGEWEMVNGLTNMPMGVGFYPTHWMPEPEPPK
jgi:hypothetical protein